MNEELTGGMVLPGFPTEITALWMRIQAGKIKTQEKSFER
jgi:hypothetical protein